MVGHQVLNFLEKSNKYNIYDLSRSKKFRVDTRLLDVINFNELQEYIKEIDPDYIINCIGILINGSKKDISNAIMINSYLPHYLAKIADKINSFLIHISTDCVFSGSKGSYTENDFRDGNDAYSRTKILGEVINTKHLTLRTSVIGPEIREKGDGLFHWFMSQQKQIHGYKNTIWSGVTTIEFAKVVKWAIESKITGIYHVTNNSDISKYNLLELFKKYFKKKIDIIPFENKKVDKSFKDTRQLLNYKIPTYDQMIEEMAREVLDNKDLYKHYF